MRSHSAALADLWLVVQNRPALMLQWSACLCLQSAGIKGVHHPNWLTWLIFIKTSRAREIVLRLTLPNAKSSVLSIHIMKNGLSSLPLLSYNCMYKHIHTETHNIHTPPTQKKKKEKRKGKQIFSWLVGCFFWDGVSPHSPGYPGILCMDQAGLNLRSICVYPPSAGIKGISYYLQWKYIFNKINKYWLLLS